MTTLSAVDVLKTTSHDHKQHFNPYQRQRDFIEAHEHAPVAILSAGNGCGKTAVGAYIDACHFTGDYPEWWNGFKFEGPGEYWVFSTSPKTLINGIQEQLFCVGGFHRIYSAWQEQERPWPVDTHRGGKISKRSIIDMHKAPNVSKGNDYVESITVKHRKGGESHIWFGHYDLGAKKVAAKHNILMSHFDEIPPFDIYSEVVARQRTTDTGLKIIITATPERKADQATIQMLFDDEWEKIGNSRTIITIDDVPDSVISRQNKRLAKAQTPERDKPAKLYGQPVSGSIFFEMGPEEFRISQSEWINLKSKNSYSVIHGIDFGFNDDTALVSLYTNTIDGTTVLEKSIKKRWMNAILFSGAAKQAGFDLQMPTAWPHDGLRRDKDMTTTKEGRESKKMLAQFYKETGFNMLSSHNQRFATEANKHNVFAEIESQASQGMFYVVAGNTDFDEEWRNLQIGDDGKVKGKDHILDATIAAWLRRKSGKRISADPIANPLLWGNTAQTTKNLGVSPHLLR